MPEEEYATFKKFNDPAILAEVGLLLKEHDIQFQPEDSPSNFEPTFRNNEVLNEFELKLKKEDFERADVLLQKFYSNEIEEVDEDYYLFHFSDEELMEIITKKDEWGEFDFVLAQKILKNRGIEIEPETIKDYEKKRIEELSKPERSSGFWIYVGYVMAVMGGLFGLFIGWNLSTFKKTLPNGEKIYGYSEADRKHGNRILIIGIIFLVFWMIMVFLNLK